MRIETFHLAGNGRVPNNPRLPVTLYREAVDARGAETAGRFERLFTDHAWPPDWRGGIYDDHHYHSTAHEVLGVFAGHATLELGGEGGRRVDVSPGDAILLPAGTGHRCIRASKDFAVVGAYPRRQDWDICRKPADAGVRQRIETLPDPAQDPVTGHRGGLSMRD